MTRPSSSAIALCSAIAFGEAGEIPEWVHLLPAGQVTTQDGRGPYRVDDGAKLIAASLQSGQRLVLDECHSTDLAAPKGEPAPARGWIVELQSRADGIWGKVEWTGKGRELLQHKEYRGISPVITHTKAGIVTGILRASLTNQPNLNGLQALHQEDHNMDLKKWLLETLGLDAEAGDDAIIEGLKKKLADKPAVDPALQSAIGDIAKAVGLKDGADTTAVLAGVKAMAADKDGKGDARVVALQSELTAVTGKLDTLTESVSKERASAFVDGAIRDGRMGLKPVRDEYITMHMKDPAHAEKLINAMPKISGKLPETRGDGGDDDAHSDPALLAAEAGIYQKKLADAGQTIDFAAAVMAVKEGRHK